MSAPKLIKGQCLCGAVTVEATVDEPKLTACSCDMCRQHTSSMFIALQADPASVKVFGPAKSFRSSDWAERGFCSECGSTLWYGTVHDGARYLSAGLFENAGGCAVEIQYFTDQCPQGYMLAGEHRRLTKEQTIELFTNSEGETQ